MNIAETFVEKGARVKGSAVVVLSYKLFHTKVLSDA